MPEHRRFPQYHGYGGDHNKIVIREVQSFNWYRGFMNTNMTKHQIFELASSQKWFRNGRRDHGVTEVTRKSEIWGHVKISFYLRPTGELRDAMALIHKYNTHWSRACNSPYYNGTIVRKMQIDIWVPGLETLHFTPNWVIKLPNFGLCPSYYDLIVGGIFYQCWDDSPVSKIWTFISI